MVSKCVLAGGEKDPNRGGAPSGVLNIEANTKRVDTDEAEVGNIVTFRNEKRGAYPYHTGVITAVQRDGDGKVEVLTVVHSSSSANGPTSSMIDPRSPNALGKGVRVQGVYKWDTKPDHPVGATQTKPANDKLVNPEANPR
jgi:hypothetical protein